jgi:hypothetical protein
MAPSKISVNSATIWSPFACAKRSNASRWASSPRPNPFFPDLACLGANSIVGNDRLHTGTLYFNPLLADLQAENGRRYTRAKQTEHGHHVPGRVVCRQDGASSIRSSSVLSRSRNYVPMGCPIARSRRRRRSAAGWRPYSCISVSGKLIPWKSSGDPGWSLGGHPPGRMTRRVCAPAHRS